jgi:hypothetical protein
MSLTVKLLTAIFKDPYEDYPEKEIIGIFSNTDTLEKAIEAYKDRKRKYDCEFMLESTTFDIKNIILDSYKES